MKQFALSTKLLGGFICVAFITLAVGYLGWSSATRLIGYLNAVGKQDLPGIQSVLTIQKNLETIRTSQNALMNPLNDQARRKRFFGYIAQSRENYQKDWKAYEALPKETEESKIWEQAKKAVIAWEVENNKAFDMAKDLDKEGVVKADIFVAMNKQFLDKCLPLQRESLGLMEKLVALNAEDAAHTMARADADASRTKLLAGLGMGVGSGLALALGIILGLSITRPINRIIAELNDGADQVAAAATEVSGAGQELARGSSEQAASLEETSASLEEMASMTRQNADNAKQADSLMQETGRVVQAADRYMQDLTTSMQEISQASNDTAKIIKTIDEIAFQTNLLALNAAVEAARAGEAGAGFAVVADEVRNLAMRAAEAARNTASLIEGTVDKVKSGSDLVAKTGEAFGQVTTSAGKVQLLVAEIAATSQEQAQGADQISKAVAAMDTVVQHTAANAEESASASEELNAQAAQMKDVIGDLVTLVAGGTRTDSGRSFSRPGTGRMRPQSGTAAGPGKRKVKALLTRQVQEKGHNERLSPEQVIPLDSNDFKDF